MKPECITKLKEQFKSELMAYHAYAAMLTMTQDEYLEDALEEIMYDEYLHAKFLRSYMLDKGVYDTNQHEDLEKMYWKMVHEE
jgi:ferritin